MQAGIHERVLTVAFEKQSESEAMWALSLPIPFQPPMHAGAGGYFAPHIRSYMARSKAPDHIGILVALKDRQNALKNPYAHLHEHEISFDSIKDSMMLWDPIRYAETCPSSDGACTLVLASESVADRTASPAWVHGTAMRSEPTMSADHDPVLPRGGSDCAADVYRQAGITNHASRSTRSRCTCRSRGSNRCGSRTCTSPLRGRAGAWWRTASPSSTATCR